MNKEIKKQETKKIGICDTTFRDAHQSLLATRLKTEDILEVAGLMDEIGFAAMEVWGGATFDTCMRFLNEDPWERLRLIRKACPKTKLQMLMRGQNLVGYRHYADDVVDEFVKRAVANGIDNIRIFDALNDIRNIERAVAAAKKEGAHVQAAISYTHSPVHNAEYYKKLCVAYKNIGADSICIKDMAGIMYPYDGFELVKAIKEQTKLPIEMHSHYTSGMASMTYMKVVEAGGDILDCALSSMASSTSQPAIESIVAAFQGTPYDTGLDLAKLAQASAKMAEIRKKYAKFDVADPRVDTNVLLYQMPGGMISNFMSQLKDANASDKLQECLEEVPRIRKDMGYPPLVTPTSQIVGSQAMLNVISGQRYKMVTNEVKNYFKGEYGCPPGPVDEAIRKQIIGDEPVITERYANLLPPQLEEATKEIAEFMETPEDLLSYIMFPQVARKFLEDRMAGKTRVEYNMMGGKGESCTYCPV